MVNQSHRPSKMPPNANNSISKKAKSEIISGSGNFCEMARHLTVISPDFDTTVRYKNMTGRRISENLYSLTFAI